MSFDREKVVFDWDGKTVERKPEELKEKGVRGSLSRLPSATAYAGRAGEVDTADPAPDAPKVSEKIGADNGGGIRQCVQGDTTPAGTIIDGYKKVITTEYVWTDVHVASR